MGKARAKDIVNKLHRDTLKKAYAENAIEQVVIEDALNSENWQHYLEDVTQHGCVSGVVPHLVYYYDTIAFYNQHEELIWKMLGAAQEEGGLQHPLELIASFNGANNVSSGAQFKNLLARWAYEHAAYNLLTRRQEI